MDQKNRFILTLALVRLCLVFSLSLACPVIWSINPNRSRCWKLLQGSLVLRKHHDLHKYNTAQRPYHDNAIDCDEMVASFRRICVENNSTAFSGASSLFALFLFTKNCGCHQSATKCYHTASFCKAFSTATTPTKKAFRNELIAELLLNFNTTIIDHGGRNSNKSYDNRIMMNKIKEIKRINFQKILKTIERVASGSDPSSVVLMMFAVTLLLNCVLRVILDVKQKLLGDANYSSKEEDSAFNEHIQGNGI